MAQQLENIPIKISYGHDDTHVLMQFSRPVQMTRNTPEQARDMIREIENSLAALAAHQAKKAH